LNTDPSPARARLPSAAISIGLSAAAISVMSFLIIYSVTASCSILAISLFVGLVLALPFLLIPAAFLGIKASRQQDPGRQLTSLLLLLDIALLLALLALLVA